MTECPECNGKGYRTLMTSADWRARRHVCLTCGASGSLTDEELAAYQLGRQLRERRVNVLRRSQSEVAKDLGINPKLVSDWERGRFHDAPDFNRYRQIVELP